jgi:tetratricopeptide (TPR) repeat protein
LRNRGHQLFWEGNYDAAVESYQSLLEEEPMNHNAWGELGNIYYAKKDMVRAANAFVRAVTILNELGMRQEADKIITVIRGLNPQLADTTALQMK